MHYRGDATKCIPCVLLIQNLSWNKIKIYSPGKPKLMEMLMGFHSERCPSFGH
jgi:hypothetical protein